MRIKESGTTWNAETIAEINSQAMLADGMDEAILGLCIQFGNSPVVAYDYENCIQILMSRDEMSREDALDFMEFNIVNAYVGMNTPVFIIKE